MHGPSEKTCTSSDRAVERDITEGATPEADPAGFGTPRDGARGTRERAGAVTPVGAARAGLSEN
jgi:hypothetical protein